MPWEFQHLPRDLLTSSSAPSSNIPYSLWPPSSARIWHRDILAPFTLKVFMVFSISRQTAFLLPGIWLSRNCLRKMFSSSVARINDDLNYEWPYKTISTIRLATNDSTNPWTNKAEEDGWRAIPVGFFFSEFLKKVFALGSFNKPINLRGMFIYFLKSPCVNLLSTILGGDCFKRNNFRFLFVVTKEWNPRWHDAITER